MAHVKILNWTGESYTTFFITSRNGMTYSIEIELPTVDVTISVVTERALVLTQAETKAS